MKFNYNGEEIEMRTSGGPIPTLCQDNVDLVRNGMESVEGWRNFPEGAGVAIQCPLCGKIKSPAFPAENDGWLQCDGCGMIGHIMAPKRLQMNKSNTAFNGPWNQMYFYQDNDGPVKADDFTLEGFLERLDRLHDVKPKNFLNYMFGREG